MSPLRIIVFFLIFSLYVSKLCSQIKINDKAGQGGWVREEKPTWVVGIGWNGVDDNSNAFKKIFDFRESWNIPAYPTQLSVDVSDKHGLSYGGVFNFNIYKPGKLINGKAILGSFLFFSLDLNAKYHINHILKTPRWMDVYASAGPGFTLRFAPPYRYTGTFNIGGGCNFWLNKWIGINAQSLGKFGLRSPIIRTASNYLQHSAGFIFKVESIPWKKFPRMRGRYHWIHRKNTSVERVK